MDNFQSDYDKADKEVTSLNMALDEIRDIKKKNSSGSVVSQEYKMKQSNLKINNMMNDLEVLANEYQNSGSRFNISAKDRQKRVDKIIALKKTATGVQGQYDFYLQSKSGGMQNDEEQPMVRVKGTDNEYDDTRDLTS